MTTVCCGFLFVFFVHWVQTGPDWGLESHGRAVVGSVLEGQVSVWQQWFSLRSLAAGLSLRFLFDGFSDVFRGVYSAAARLTLS